MARTVSLEFLSSLTVASPCSADWDSMVGDERVRHCGECKLNVYNLSAMSADEAAALVQAREGRMCIRLYKRADGTAITRDCPVGLRAVRIKAARAAGRVAAAVALLVSGGLAAATGSREQRLPKLVAMRPFSTIRAWLVPGQVNQQQQGRIFAGEVCVPPPIAPVPPPSTR